ncbi:putative HAT dimerization domain-containing protein [Helianthus debilis subsp. tardiflorus]
MMKNESSDSLFFDLGQWPQALFVDLGQWQSVAALIRFVALAVWCGTGSGISDRTQVLPARFAVADINSHHHHHHHRNSGIIIIRIFAIQELKECCYRLEDALKYEGESDIDAKELYTELKLITTFLPRHIDNPFDVSDYIFQRSTTYHYAINAYKVLLTILVTVASAERSFSKLKLLKTYLRSTMSQERLNGLATISIESEILDTMDYKELIESFASKNARRTTLFA